MLFVHPARQTVSHSMAGAGVVQANSEFSTHFRSLNAALNPSQLALRNVCSINI